ncbi:MAG: 30S ribosomal protein S7 [Candidatus Heimdallarchaeota archaeon]
MPKSKAEKEAKDKSKKADTKKADAKKAETKKAETKKAETKKEEPKEEKVKKESKAAKAKTTDKKEKKDEKAVALAKTEKKPAEVKAAPEKPSKAIEEAPTKKPVSAPKKKAEVKKEEEQEVEEDTSALFEGIKLFNKWDYKDLVVTDPGLKAYICLRPVITPHTGGRYEHKRFKKAEMPIVERLVNKLMRRRKGTGKKERMIKAVKIAFEIIHLKTGKNPIQVLIDAIQNAAPREEVTRITYGGMAQLQSVDVAPMRRVDIALTNIVEGTYKKAFNNILTAEEILAQELIDAADNKTSSYAVSKMLEIERVALSAR